MFEAIGDYQILEEIGTGGMATVYKAVDPVMDRHVAIKVLPPHYAKDAVFRKRFEREAKAIARLEHLHILPVFSYGEDKAVIYMVMRYMGTGTLTDVIRHSPLSFKDCARITRQVASALDYAHANDIIHRDVKPSNILLDDAKNAFLTDFGIAKMLQATHLTNSGSLVGTPQYMSPEQCMGDEITPMSDQYSLGVVLYEMLTGKIPYVADTPMGFIRIHMKNEPLPLPHHVRPNLPPMAEQVLVKALSRTPQDRFPTCTEMATVFETAIDGVSERTSTARTPIHIAAPPETPALTDIDTVRLDTDEMKPPDTVKKKQTHDTNQLLLIGLVVLMVIMGIFASGFIRLIRMLDAIEDAQTAATQQAMPSETPPVVVE